MRWRLLVLAAAAAAWSCGGCGSGDGRKALVVYSPHGRDILQEFEVAFERVHPDVDVVTVYASAAGLLARVRGEKANPQAAVWWGGPAQDFDVAAREGLLDPYQPTYAQEGLPSHRDGYWTACFHLPVVLGYNPALVKREDLPRRWDGLGDERWRGRIVLREPREAGTLRTLVGALVLRARAAGGSDDAGFALLDRIDANVRTYEGSPELMFEKLESGPAALTVWNLTDLVFQNQQRGYHFLPAGLDEPVPVILDGIALVKGAAARPEAKAFYEYVNTLDAHRILAQRHGRIPARPDFDRSLLNEAVRAVPYAPQDLDLAALADNLPAWMARFDELRAARRR